MGYDQYKNKLSGQRRGTMSARQAMACISMTKKISTFEKAVGEGTGKFY